MFESLPSKWYVFSKGNVFFNVFSICYLACFCGALFAFIFKICISFVIAGDFIFNVWLRNKHKLETM